MLALIFFQPEERNVFDIKPPDIQKYKMPPIVKLDGKIPPIQGENTPNADAVCRLLGSRTKTSNIPGADLGVVFTHYLNGKHYLYFAVGDINQNPINTSNALARSSSNPADCLDLEWLAHPIYPAKRIVGVDFSTVPAGGISLNNKIYLYMMQVLDWGVSPPPARALLLKSEDDGKTFSQVPGVTWGVSNKIINTKFINVAPVLSKKDGYVYLFGTGTYRGSAIYLARVSSDKIENLSEYSYYTASGNWSSNPNDAIAIVDGQIGELSVQWNSFLNKWVMMYYDLSGNGVAVRTSKEPWGEWSKPAIVFKENPASLEQFAKYNERTTKCLLGSLECDEYFANIYAPYVLPNEFQSSDNQLYFTISLWSPYTVFLMKTEPII